VEGSIERARCAPEATDRDTARESPIGEAEEAEPEERTRRGHGI